MAAWSDRVGDLLRDGETIEAERSVDTATVYVTPQRVLAFTPELAGDNFQQIDRPNVQGVSLVSGGDSRAGRIAAHAALYGLVLFGVGYFLPIDSVLGGFEMPSSSGRLGVGGVIGLIETVLDLVRSLDEVMRIGGALLLLLALVSLGVYVRSRERNVVIRAANDEDSIRLPAPESEGESLADELEIAIVPPGVRSSEGEEGRLSSLLSR